LRQTKGFEAARQFVLRGREKAAMDDAFRTLQSMDEEEDALLTARQARLNQSVRRATGAFGLTLGLELLLLGLVYYVIRKEFINRERTERALRLVRSDSGAWSAALPTMRSTN
jgi:cbb3-type cytochrome oxidase subunit 3